MIEETLTAPEESLEDLKKVFPGVATARVINLADPLSLGRVQVQLQSIDAVDLQPWARIATSMAGFSHGSYFIPNLGDEVLVAFEHGSTNAPYIIGSLWTALARPPVASPLQQVRAIRTISGNQIVVRETPPSVTMQSSPTPPEALPAPVLAAGPQSSVQVAPEGVKIYSPAMVDIQASAPTTQVLITPAAIKVTKGSSTVTITDASISLSAPAISINASGTLTLKGAQVMIN